MEAENAPRKRGRPRTNINPPKPKRKLTAAERSKIVRETAWKNRRPDYKIHQKTLTAAAEVIDAMMVIKGDLTWTDFFCQRFDIPRPPDRRRRLI